MKILVVEDDLEISGFLKSCLNEAGFQVHISHDGLEALKCIEEQSPDLMILDIMLPKLDGLSLIQQVRKDGFEKTVLILSSKKTVEDRVQGLQSGADDYVVKPFSFNDLLARVQVLLKRSVNAQPLSKLSFADITVDLISREVRRDVVKIDLHVKEFLLLEYFIVNKNKVLTKAQILEKIWGYDFNPQTNVVDVLVCRLRNKIDKDF